ncbi:MFS transporter [Streptococcus suis]|nr:MFS transporter [Streptococcus suis]NQP17276.1 MFS transporter [Streptococcus suis]
MSKRFLNLYMMNIFLSGLPYYFIGVLLLKHLGFSFTEIATLSVITELCGSVFDIPLSFLSSKFGYKKILILSNLLLTLALSCLLLGQSKIIYISAIFFGLSESLSSGVLNAYNFELIGNELVYQSFLKYLNTVKYIFIAIITIISPYLLNRNYIYPIIISIVFVIFSLLNVIQLPEIKNELPNDSRFFSFDDVKTIPWYLLLLGVAFSTLIMISNSYAGIFLNEQRLSLDMLGIVLFMFNIAMALGSYLKMKFEISLLLPVLAIFMFFQTNVFIEIVLFLLMRVLNSSYNNHFYSMFNSSIEKNRAVSWSVYNLFISISFMVSDFLAGIFADNFGIRSNYLLFGIITLFSFLFFSFSNREERT